MLENKRLFIFANKSISKSITEFFLVPYKKMLHYTNYCYCYETRDEFLYMIEHYEITNLYLADYFFIEYDYIKNRYDLLENLISIYHKPIICIFKELDDLAAIEKKISYKICKDTFEQDLSSCIIFLHNLDIQQ